MSTPVAVPRICSNSAVAAKLGELGVAGENVFIGYVENTAEDWSFGFGRAQYVTGELAVPKK